MAIFRTNPSRDVLTPQMREAMYAQLENRMRDDAIKDEIQPDIPLPRPVEEPPVAGRPRRKMIDFPGGLTDTLPEGEEWRAGVEPGQPLLTPKASEDILRRQVDEKLDAMPGNLMEPYPPQGDSASTDDPLIDIALNTTIQWEGRKDRQGNLAVYNLPSGDGGGTYEIAGINNRYHPQAAKEIIALPKQQQALAAAKYVRAYTAPLVNQLPKNLQGFAQDLGFHRGLAGATRHMQQALANMGYNIRPDGVLGPKTLEALREIIS